MLTVMPFAESTPKVLGVDAFCGLAVEAFAGRRPSVDSCKTLGTATVLPGAIVAAVSPCARRTSARLPRPTTIVSLAPAQEQSRPMSASVNPGAGVGRPDTAPGHRIEVRCCGLVYQARRVTPGSVDYSVLATSLSIKVAVSSGEMSIRVRR